MEITLKFLLEISYNENEITAANMVGDKSSKELQQSKQFCRGEFGGLDSKTTLEMVQNTTPSSQR